MQAMERGISPLLYSDSGMGPGLRARLLWLTLALVAVTFVAAVGLADAAWTRTALWITAVAGVATAVAVLVGAVLPFARGVRGLQQAVERLRAGDTDIRVPRGFGELGPLGETLGKLAGAMTRAATTAREERDLMHAILEGMQDGIMLLDTEDKIALVNPSIRHTLLLPAEVVGRTPLEAIRHADLMELVVRARKRQDAIAGEIDVAGLLPRRLLVSIAPLSARVGWLLLVFHDVTQIRRLESLRREFVANVSHELRTPVSAVRSAAETLAGGALEDPAAARMFVDIIDRNGARLGQLIEDLLDLSRIESRELKLNLEPLALPELAEQSAALLREKAGRKKHQIYVRVPAELPRARGDRRAVEQALTNLIDNAIKYCPEGARITVRGQVVDDMVEVAVEDTGPGVEERHLPRLFERFYRVDPGRSRDMGGTGLGLSIVKHVVESMGGEVGVRSEFGLGSTFWFTLPIAG
jgi:two-component system phosphate regulon sensor histidine kinase PhoR